MGLTEMSDILDSTKETSPETDLILDWFLGKRDLNREQRGVLIGLLAAIYARCGGLPCGADELQSLLGEKSIREVKRIIQELLDKGKLELVDGCLTDSRVAQKIEAFRARVEASAPGGTASMRRLNSRRPAPANNRDAERKSCRIKAASNKSRSVPPKATQRVSETRAKKLDARFRISKSRQAKVARARKLGAVDPWGAS